MSARDAAVIAVRSFAAAFGPDAPVAPPNHAEMPQFGRREVAAWRRESMGAMMGADFSHLCDAEMIDSIQYAMFPNFGPWLGEGLPLLYQFLPLGDNPDESLFTVRLMAPIPEKAPCPPCPPLTKARFRRALSSRCRSGVESPMSSTRTWRICPNIQRGMHSAAASRSQLTLGRYQEQRIALMHEFVEACLAGQDLDRAHGLQLTRPPSLGNVARWPDQFWSLQLEATCRLRRDYKGSIMCKGIRCAALACVGMMLTGPVLASEVVYLEEIVVTATKRAQSVQDVPVAVSAVDASTIEAMRIDEFTDITRISPSLTVNRGDWATNSGFSLRGIGTNVFSINIEPSVAIVVDDVPLVRSSQAFSDLLDIERIEVLRGPQSTLFGKNASAGVVNVVTQGPGEEFDFRFRGGYTTDDEFNVALTAGGPVERFRRLQAERVRQGSRGRAHRQHHHR